MKVTLQTTQLQDIVDIVGRFVSKHSTLPILENIYIKGNIDTLVLRATDMEKYIEVQIPASIDTEGAITVNARMLGDIVKAIDDDQIQINVDTTKDQMTLKTASDDFKIKGIAASEYVAVPEVQSDNTVTFDAQSFSKGIGKVEYAVTEKNFSPVLTGILMRVKATPESRKLIFVGTDSFRLAEYKIDFHGTANSLDVIIPKTNISDIKKVVDYFTSKGGEQIDMKFSENLLSCSASLDGMQMTMTSLLIQGSFPEYENENIMPTAFETKLMVDKSQIEKAIRKISIITRDINNYISLQITPDTLFINSGETDRGEANSTLSAIVSGNDVTLGLNGKYVTDFVRAMENTDISINIVNGEKPVIFMDKDDPSYKYVIRPLVK